VNVSIFTGDITDAPADAICTSTNPRLSLMMGTGGAVRERGGFGVLRECEAIVAGSPPLRAGSVHVTSAGSLPYKAVIHCVASDAHHASSAAVVRACVTNALAAAERVGCSRVAMPVFATGHAHVRFRDALAAMGEALRSASTTVSEVIVVVAEADRVEEAATALARSSP
jgi:O-acetyl-ADP-ribose deacetylase (regulator of RNase III)